MKKLIQDYRAFCAAMVCAGLTAAAQSVPQLINYQGQLLDAGGTPMPTGDYDVEMRLYPVESGGAVVWGPQIFNGQSGVGLGPKVSVVNGHFNLVIGPKDTADRNLGDIVAANPSLFLEIKVGTGSPIAPRQQLLTAPYALTAASSGNAAKLNGFDWGALFSNGNPQTGNLGLGQPPTSATMKLDVKGRARVRQTGAETAGIWLNQLVNNAELDRSFIGMADNNRVGFWSSPLGYWPFTVDVTTGQTTADTMVAALVNTSYLIVDNVSIDNSPLGGFSVSGAPDYTFYGVVWANSFRTFSDERLKEDIEAIEDPLGKIHDIRAVTFSFKKDMPLPGLEPGKRHIGVLAQDVQKVLPEAVTARPDGYLGVNYDALIPVLLQAVKEQQKQIEALQVEVTSIKQGSR